MGSIDMKVLNRDYSKGHVRLRVENMDDLWYLHQIIVPNTRVGAWTWRKLESRDDLIRPEISSRKRIFLEIEVENVEFHPFTDNLRIKGVVVRGPPEISGYHTHTLEVGSEIKYINEKIGGAEIQVIEEAESRSGRPRVIVVSLDDDESIFYTMSDYGFDEVAKVKAGHGGKRFKSESKWDGYYKEQLKVLETIQSPGMAMIVVGPGFFKEKLARMIRDKRPDLARELYVVGASQAALGGVKEALGKPEALSGIIESSRMAEEVRMLDSFFEKIGKGSGAAYGGDQVEDAIFRGAVEILLVSDRVFREGTGRDLFEKGRKVGSRGTIISSHHEQGRMFDKMGGIGALLRFDPSH